MVSFLLIPRCSNQLCFSDAPCPLIQLTKEVYGGSFGLAAACAHGRSTGAHLSRNEGRQSLKTNSKFHFGAKKILKSFLINFLTRPSSTSSDVKWKNWPINFSKIVSELFWTKFCWKLGKLNMKQASHLHHSTYLSNSFLSWAGALV